MVIFNQCPVNGGEAVHTARALRAEAEGTPLEYDDECVSGQAYRENPGAKQASTFVPNSLVISPNPGSGDLTVYLPEGFTGSEALITDLYGRTKQTIPLNGDQRLTLNTQDWPAGVYFFSAPHGFQTKFIISY